MPENEAYRESYRQAIRDLNLPNVQLIEGGDLLTSIAGLTQDLVHPSDHGMITMGQKLAAIMSPIIHKT